MKKCGIFLAVPIIFLSCVGTGHKHGDSNHHHGRQAGGGNLTPHYENSLFKVTDKNLFSVELLFKEGAYSVGNNTMDLIVHRDVTGNRDVEGAAVSIVPWMPEHGHGVQTKPKVIERGAGLYTVENLEASMEGRWELRIAIDSEYGNDSVVFDFPQVRKEKKRGHGGHHSAEGMPMHDMKAPEGTDLSSVRMSERSLFRVGYGTDFSKIPLNKIHSWKLKVETKDGSPVSGAEIKVDGDMPAHGHGLPTTPLVTRETEPGSYLVEGMKFTMPGYWLVNFYIKKGAETDAATFHFELQ